MNIRQFCILSAALLLFCAGCVPEELMLRRDLENPNIFKIKVYDVNSKFTNTIIVNRTMRVNGSSDGDFTYTANWDNKQVALTCFLTETN